MIECNKPNVNIELGDGPYPVPRSRRPAERRWISPYLMPSASPISPYLMLSASPPSPSPWLTPWWTPWLTPWSTPWTEYIWTGTGLQSPRRTDDFLTGLSFAFSQVNTLQSWYFTTHFHTLPIWYFQNPWNSTGRWWQLQTGIWMGSKLDSLPT